MPAQEEPRAPAALFRTSLREWLARQEANRPKDQSGTGSTVSTPRFRPRNRIPRLSR